MTTAIIALAISSMLALFAAASADNTAAIVNRDRAQQAARQVAESVIDSCAQGRCQPPSPPSQPAPHQPNSPTNSNTPNSTAEPNPSTSVCVSGTTLIATAQVSFETRLFAGLSPAVATFLSDFSELDRSAFAHLTPCAR